MAEDRMNLPIGISPREEESKHDTIRQRHSFITHDGTHYPNIAYLVSSLSLPHRYGVLTKILAGQ